MGEKKNFPYTFPMRKLQQLLTKGLLFLVKGTHLRRVGDVGSGSSREVGHQSEWGGAQSTNSWKASKEGCKVSTVTEHATEDRNETQGNYNPSCIEIK